MRDGLRRPSRTGGRLIWRTSAGTMQDGGEVYLGVTRYDARSSVTIKEVKERQRRAVTISDQCCASVGIHTHIRAASLVPLMAARASPDLLPPSS